MVRFAWHIQKLLTRSALSVNCRPASMPICLGCQLCQLSQPTQKFKQRQALNLQILKNPEFTCINVSQALHRMPRSDDGRMMCLTLEPQLVYINMFKSHKKLRSWKVLIAQAQRLLHAWKGAEVSHGILGSISWPWPAKLHRSLHVTAFLPSWGLETLLLMGLPIDTLCTDGFSNSVALFAISFGHPHSHANP